MSFLVSMSILAIAFVICVIEVPLLWKAKQKKELGVFSLLLLMGVILNILLAFHVQIPNPYDWISAVYKPMNDTIMEFLN